MVKPNSLKLISFGDRSKWTLFNMHIVGLYQAVESVSRRQIKPSCASISYKYLKTNAGDFGEYELWDVDLLKLGHLECLVDIFIYRSYEKKDFFNKICWNFIKIFITSWG
jgi:hypothetical protein